MCSSDLEAVNRKNELFSILVSHLNRYPSTKVYTISKEILNNATENNDDTTILNVSNLVLDSALSGGDYVLAQQCIQNILTRILNPKLLQDGQDVSVQFILYSCIQAKIAFNLAMYNQCVAVCDKIINIATPETLDKIASKGADKSQIVSYIMDVLVYSAICKVLMCDGTVEEFFERVKEHFGRDILSKNYLKLFNRLYHKEEFDNDAGISNDDMSMFIANILTAFKGFDQGYNIFAQNVYKAKQLASSADMRIFSSICDLLIGYSYQKLNLENPVSWKKTETIYEDVLKIAQKSGYNSVVQLTNWFKASLLKDKGLYKEAYDLIVTVSNSLKRQHIKNRLLSFLTYVLTLNIASNIEDLKAEVPILVYRITYEAEKYNFEGYYKFIEDQRVLDPAYMAEFKEAIAAEQAAILAEQQAEAEADAQESKV